MMQNGMKDWPWPLMLLLKASFEGLESAPLN